VKILSGNLRGRSFDQPKTSSVRPLSDKVRAAIFDVVGSPARFTVLDAYAGSGAAGFEAMSRGAIMVEAIEANPAVARVIERNARELGLDWGYLLHVVKLESWLAQPANQPDPDKRIARYDLIIADPPYARLDTDLLQRLGRFLLPGGVLVISRSSKLKPADLSGLTLAKQKTYGDTALDFYS
jgi:16S rRNA (guanine966-N2)-methyltransferase